MKNISFESIEAFVIKMLALLLLLIVAMRLLTHEFASLEREYYDAKTTTHAK